MFQTINRFRQFFGLLLCLSIVQGAMLPTFAQTRRKTTSRTTPTTTKQTSQQTSQQTQRCAGGWSGNNVGFARKVKKF